MNFVIKYEKKLKTGPLISSERFRHVWSAVFEKLQISVNVVLHMWKTDEYKFSICRLSGIAAPWVWGAGSYGVRIRPSEVNRVRHSPGIYMKGHRDEVGQASPRGQPTYGGWLSRARQGRAALQLRQGCTQLKAEFKG